MRRAIKDKHARFCLEFLQDGNAAAAYRRAGYAVKNADVNAARLMQRPDIQLYIRERRKEIENQLTFNAASIMNLLWDIVNADYTELSKVKNLPCKYCRSDGPILAQSPDPMCPECDGMGRRVVQYAESQYLSRQGKLIYQGAVQTPWGIRLSLTSKMKALELLMRMYLS
ncbi:hypothetical protein FHS72_003541 [Loktanella ponticola]|uniref:Terminase small subunit n=1 Tax=Yoonia ponticola TaxID=1524255 RepID=A0A7W9EZN0_9RHOB|nr:terminase small subunit [Yoonia ponticola]MBB5723894.1 hypothetical protein [Yoonia ponticola]